MTHDVAVVGAGPAGLAAAAEVAGAGLDCVLSDAGERPGGQYWRHGEDARGRHGWSTFLDLSGRLSEVRYLPGTQVWLITRDDRGFTLRLTGNDPVVARALILCPGGYDRQLPIPGWELPGVMAAGGVQAMLKGHGTLPGRRAVVAGTGPFLLPVAAELARAGATVAAVVEANRVTGWLRDPAGALAVPVKAVEALGYAAEMARRRVPYRTRTVITEIVGDGRVEAVRLSGESGEVAADLVALGWGFTPSLELPLMVGAETRLDRDGSLVAVVDDMQRSTVEGVYVAGEATGVGGAALALAEGRLAGLAVARSADRARIRRLRRAIRRGRRFAAAMHRACPIPPAWPARLTDPTVVCRCEEVSYGDLRRAGDLGADDARTLKMLARPGMGWCQGRMCGFATAAIAAHLNGRAVTADDLRAFATRPLAFPVTLDELAGGSKGLLTGPGGA
jgi:thioredoxin reductase